MQCSAVVAMQWRLLTTQKVQRRCTIPICLPACLPVRVAAVRPSLELTGDRDRRGVMGVLALMASVVRPLCISNRSDPPLLSSPLLSSPLLLHSTEKLLKR